MKNKSRLNGGRIGFIIAAVILLVIAVAGFSGWYPALREALAETFSTDLGGYRLTPVKLIAAIAALAFVYLLCAALTWLLQVFSKNTRVKTVTELVSSVIRYLGVILGVVWALTILGLNATAAFASLGIITLIIGFASQRLIEDVISGLFIVMEGQYNVGDIIILDDFRGTVQRIGVRTTTIVDPGGNYKVVNNSDIRNFQNRSKALSLAVSEIGITYEEDIPRVEAILKDALPAMLARNADVFLAAPKYLGVEALADSAVVLRFTVDCTEENVFAARRRLNRELRVLFAEKNIDIPFPQLTVHQGA
ncbi:MAG: mechanosensitive ion channel family protein [Clostridia bacterium]|nr:mechanosensitive ion channel family protein [Clostridia bacterium]